LRHLITTFCIEQAFPVKNRLEANHMDIVERSQAHIPALIISTGTENATWNATVIRNTSLTFDVKNSKQNRAVWIVFVVLETIMLVATFYIFSSLLYHLLAK